MANSGKFKDKNPDLRSAGMCNPPSPLGLQEILSMPTTNDPSTYGNDFSRMKMEKTEMSALGVNKHLTEIVDTMNGPFSYLDEIRPGEMKKKYPLGRGQDPHLPDDWDRNKPFGMKNTAGLTTAQVLEAQGRTTSEPIGQSKLGKPKRRYSRGVIDTNQSFGIHTPSDPRGGLMWELFSGECYGEDEDEQQCFFI